ncbi:MAG: mandelate racemase/muconate lactonizing enzyme family protein [Acuticoccus sp.]
MKITRLETFTIPLVGFVRVTTDTGAQGWGQFSTYNADITCEVFHRQVARHALGADASATEALVRLIGDRELKFPGTYLRRATAGLDTALWDLKGKREGKPVTALIGGTPGKLRIYGSSMRRDITPAEEAERLCRLRDTDGITAFKWRVGREAGRDVDEWPGRTEEVVPHVAAALGDGVTKLVDGNSGFSSARAIAVGRMLEDCGVTHFEEPCPYWEHAETKAVTDALAIDVTGGEQDCEIATWEALTAGRIMNVAQPDVLYLGGISRTLEVARLAAAAGMKVTPHSANHGLVTLCAMHVLRAIDNAGPYLEYSIEGPYSQGWAKHLFLETDTFAVEDGHVTVSDAPGWGVTVNPDFLAKAAYRVSALD